MAIEIVNPASPFQDDAPDPGAPGGALGSRARARARGTPRGATRPTTAAGKAVVARLDAATAARRRARLLPPAKPLDRVINYEAHLNRLLLATLHELEALQRRRQGDATPLARLSVSSNSDPALPWLHTQT